MAGAFQGNAFQNNAFQTGTTVVVVVFRPFIGATVVESGLTADAVSLMFGSDLVAGSLLADVSVQLEARPRCGSGATGAIVYPHPLHDEDAFDQRLEGGAELGGPRSADVELNSIGDS